MIPRQVNLPGDDTPVIQSPGVWYPGEFLKGAFLYSHKHFNFTWVSYFYVFSQMARKLVFIIYLILNLDKI